MGILIVVGLLMLFLASLVMPWIQWRRINNLMYEVDRLRKDVSWLMPIAREKGFTAQDKPVPCSISQSANPPVIQTEPVKPSLWEAPPPAEEPEVEEIISKPAPTANDQFDQWQRKDAPSPEINQPKKPQISFEQQFGARLPVWIGGIALALAGLFMVKYSKESGLLSPTMRLVLGGLFGIGLLGAGQWIRGKSHIANDKRIAQALAGAGIADLYICLFAASSLYHMLPSFIGFICMAVVTGMAVILSLRHGAPIALLGLIGGFLTPALVGSNERMRHCFSFISISCWLACLCLSASKTGGGWRFPRY